MLRSLVGSEMCIRDRYCGRTYPLIYKLQLWNYEQKVDRNRRDPRISLVRGRDIIDQRRSDGKDSNRDESKMRVCVRFVLGQTGARRQLPAVRLPLSNYSCIAALYRPPASTSESRRQSCAEVASWVLTVQSDTMYVLDSSVHRHGGKQRSYNCLLRIKKHAMSIQSLSSLVYS